MNVTHDMSVLSLITGASVLVQLVMAGLLLCSVFSWYYIFLKVFTFKRASQQSEAICELLFKQRIERQHSQFSTLVSQAA